MGAEGRLWMLAVLVALVPVACGLRCVNCKGCSKFEESQAVTCSSSADRCLKLHLPSGLINRECGDEKTCVDRSNDRDRFLAVHCCETNMCNAGHRTGGGRGAVLALLAASFRFFFFRY